LSASPQLNFRKQTADGRCESVSRRLLAALPTGLMHRRERVADILREEIAQLVGYELEDPRLMMVTVTEVRLSDNMRAARVYVTVAGTEEEHKAALVALRHAAPYVRKRVGLSLNLPRTPELHFLRDTVEEEGERVDQLLEKIEIEWKSKERVEDDL
jgi:ribosome-binding factor A